MTKNNVNPDHYKTGGRLRQGENILQDAEKQKLARERSRRESRFLERDRPQSDDEEKLKGGQKTGRRNSSSST